MQKSNNRIFEDLGVTRPLNVAERGHIILDRGPPYRKYISLVRCVESIRKQPSLIVRYTYIYTDARFVTRRETKYPPPDDSFSPLTRQI